MGGKTTGAHRRCVRLWRYGANATLVESTEGIVAKSLRPMSGYALHRSDRTYPLLSLRPLAGRRRPKLYISEENCQGVMCVL